MSSALLMRNVLMKDLVVEAEDVFNAHPSTKVTAFGDSFGGEVDYFGTVKLQDKEFVPTYIKRFVVYHEFSHYVLGHYKTAWILPWLSVTLPTISVYAWRFKRPWASGAYGMTLGFICYSLFFPFNGKKEMQANNFAADHLIKTGREYDLMSMIAYMHISKNTCSGWGHPTMDVEREALINHLKQAHEFIVSKDEKNIRFQYKDIDHIAPLRRKTLREGIKKPPKTNQSSTNLSSN